MQKLLHPAQYLFSRSPCLLAFLMLPVRLWLARLCFLFYVDLPLARELVVWLRFHLCVGPVRQKRIKTTLIETVLNRTLGHKSCRAEINIQKLPRNTGSKISVHKNGKFCQERSACDLDQIPLQVVLISTRPGAYIHTYLL